MQKQTNKKKQPTIVLGDSWFSYVDSTSQCSDFTKSYPSWTGDVTFGTLTRTDKNISISTKTINLVLECAYCHKEFTFNTNSHYAPEFIVRIKGDKYVACCSKECQKKLEKSEEKKAVLIL